MATNDVYLRPDAGDGTNGVRLRPDAPDPSKIDYVLTCSAGNYTYTGNAATFVFARNLFLSAGSYAYTGNPATFQVQRNLALAKGSYNYVGNDATLTYIPGAVNYSLQCEPGAYIYSGNDAVLDYAPGVVNYDTHDGGDDKKKAEAFKKSKELLRKQLIDAVDEANDTSIPFEVEKVKQAIPAAITKEDIKAVTHEVNLLITQIYMQIALEKAAKQDEDDVAIVMLLNG